MAHTDISTPFRRGPGGIVDAAVAVEKILPGNKKPGNKKRQTQKSR